MPAEVVGSITLPQPFAPRDPAFHAAVATELRSSGLGTLAAAGSAHPVSQCPDVEDHLQALEDAEKIEAKRDRVRSRQDRRQARLVLEFGHVIDLLERRGYVQDWRLSDQGRQLIRLYHESDLLIVEAMAEGIFGGLDAGEVAAVASFFTYEHRSKQDPPPPRFPTPAIEGAFNRLLSLTKALNASERDVLGSARTRLPDAGFAHAAFNWSTGASLDAVLSEETTGGDFVRNIRQLLDLLRQLAASGATRDLRREAGEAAAGLDRGVVRAASDIGAIVEADAERTDADEDTETDGDT